MTVLSVSVVGVLAGYGAYASRLLEARLVRSEAVRALVRQERLPGELESYRVSGAAVALAVRRNDEGGSVQ